MTLPLGLIRWHMDPSAPAQPAGTERDDSAWSDAPPGADEA